MRIALPGAFEVANTCANLEGKRKKERKREREREARRKRKSFRHYNRIEKKYSDIIFGPHNLCACV